MIINGTVSIIEKLKAMGACAGPGDAIPWVLSRPKNKRDLKSLWEDCPRADWMLWLARRCKPNPAEMVAAAWACAHLAQAYADDAARANAARAARAAAAAAAAAVDGDAYVVVRDAAYDAARAADAAYDDAAYAARAARAADAYAAAYAAAQKDCADMVRLLVTCPVLP